MGRGKGSGRHVSFEQMGWVGTGALIADGQGQGTGSAAFLLWFARHRPAHPPVSQPVLETQARFLESCQRLRLDIHFQLKGRMPDACMMK